MFLGNHGFSMGFPHQSLPQWPFGSLWKLSRFGRLWPLRAILCREAKSKRQALEYGGNSFLLRQQPDIYNMLYHFISFYMNHLEALELVECHSERQSDKTSLPCWFIPAKICHGISGPFQNHTTPAWLRSHCSVSFWQITIIEQCKHLRLFDWSIIMVNNPRMVNDGFWFVVTVVAH